ncbi:MAG: MarR family transcriptional regulator [Catenulispora sp.]|nr:MarR family transcriptional regulator [Catenulispora sp.]
MPVHHDRIGRTPDRVKDRPTWLISRVHARSSALLAAGFETRGEGLRGYHYRLLAALDQWGPTSQADLGRATGIDRSDVTAALTDLESRHLVDRKVDPHHKRRNVVTLTPEGTKALLHLDEVLDEIQAAVLAPLTAAQQRQLLDLLSRIA